MEDWWTFIGMLSSLASLLCVAWLLKLKEKAGKKLPPGPIGLPVIGSIHLVGKMSHRDLHNMAQKYGPIMHLRLGFIPTIVVSSPRAAELFLKAHDQVFASRPQTMAGKLISYNQTNVSFAPYGSYWRHVRKLCTQELLSNTKINSFRWMRKEELDLVVESLRGASRTRGTVNLSEQVASLITNMTCRMVFGKKYNDDKGNKETMIDLKGLLQEEMHLFSIPNIGNYIPQLSWLDLQGLTRKMKAISDKFDDFLEMVINEHIHTRRMSGHRSQDFVGFLLELMESKEPHDDYQLKRDNIKSVALDMVAAATDTSFATIEWTLSELVKHPMIMKKVQKEVEDVVGLERMVEESDLEKLKYLKMVVKETLRLHPAVPLLLPHASTEDCVVDGFHIPKDSHLFVNLWSIGRDPVAWPEPDKFWPERFDEGMSVDVGGRDFRLLPFGSGRRSCPGMQLGFTVVCLVVAQLLHCFDWELPNGMLASDLDMMEEFGFTAPRANHLLLIPSYRLNL